MSANIVTLTFPTNSNYDLAEAKEVLDALKEFIAEMDDDANTGAAILTVMSPEEIELRKQNELIDVLNSSDFTVHIGITAKGMPDAYVVDLSNEADDDDEEDNGN